MGDAALADFSSVVAAVAPVVEIQEAAPKLSAAVRVDRRIALRFGVNVGDIVVEDGGLIFEQCSGIAFIR